MKSFFILLFLLIFISCGNEKKSHKRETPIYQSDIEEVMKNQKFECASLGGKCPGGIARIMIINPFDSEHSGVCTGFMVGPDELVTNHHCVSTDLECEFTFVAVYDGTNYERARCKQIIKTEEDVSDPNDPDRKIDYTVMKLDRSLSAGYFTLSNQSASAHDEVHVWVIDHTGLDKLPSNLFESRITEFKCRVSDQVERASLFMEKCPIISGNSGSPALNTEGDIVGVIWGGNASIIDSSVSLNVRRKLNAVGLATEADHFRSYVIP